MPALDELIAHLQALGFSQYEARAYCGLLQKSPANGHEVAKTAGIPTSKIYETLERLAQKRAVLVQRSEPTLWAPVPHRELVATLRKKAEETFAAVEQGLSQLGEEQDRRLTWSLSGHGHVVDSMRRAINRAEQRIAAAMPTAELTELTAPLRDAADRGVALDLLVGNRTTVDLPDEATVRIVRYSQSQMGQDHLAIVVGDGEETVVADLALDRPQGMWTHHPAIALLAEEHIRGHR